VSREPIRERTLAAGGAALSDQAAKRWRTQFPYHWDADDLVSRRQLLRFAVFTSGALFAGTTGLAVLGGLRSLRRTDVQPIALVGQVPEGQAYYFHYPDPDEQAMLLHLPGGRFVAYSQRCTHLSCAVYYQPERQRLFCPCHEGVFNPETGDPVAGPPQRSLEQIILRREGDLLVAVGREP
jgi:nitrite reductase/ring-hydroxylating ferredoxin subunit